jgi:hypothetical protein
LLSFPDCECKYRLVFIFFRIFCTYFFYNKFSNFYMYLKKSNWLCFLIFRILRIWLFSGTQQRCCHLYKIKSSLGGIVNSCIGFDTEL